MVATSAAAVSAARSGAEQYPALTGLRGVAALAVFALHYATLFPLPRPALWPGGPVLDLPLLFAGGWIGVSLFFVLSGALLAPPFIRWRQQGGRRPRLLSYWRRRLLRVLPAYWAQLILFATIGGWLTYHAWPDDVYAQIAHWLMFFYLGPEPVIPIAEVWWTLPVELGFYLLLPLLALGFGRRQWPWLLLGMLLASLLYRYIAAQHWSDLPNPLRVIYIQQLPGRIMEFALGISVAMLLARAPLRDGWRHPLLFGGALLIALWMLGILWVGPQRYWDGHLWMLLAPTIFGLGGAAIVAALRSGCRWGDRLFANRAIHGLGVISYSLYLWHFPVMRTLQAHAPTQLMADPVWRPLTVVAVVISAASISYWLVERPFLRWRGWQSSPANRGAASNPATVQVRD
ncbi:MAG: hypothetical protein Tsb002_05580 [Wenzhouxiangellaceae bacterium]